MHNLRQRASITDEQRNARRPNLTQVGHVYRPAGVPE